MSPSRCVVVVVGLMIGCGSPEMQSQDAGPITSPKADAGPRDAGSPPSVDAGTSTGVDAGTVSLPVAYSLSQCPPGISQLVWVAAQDGDEPWQVIAPDAGVFAWSQVHEIGAVAQVYVSTSTTSVIVTYHAKSELVYQGVTCFATFDRARLTTNLTHLPAGQSATVWLTSARDTGAKSAFTLDPVTLGTHDLFAYAPATATNPSRMLIRRGITVTLDAGVIAPDLDLTGPESFAPVSAVFTIGNGLPGEMLRTQFIFTAGADTFTALPWPLDAGATVEGVPAAQLTAADQQRAIFAAMRQYPDGGVTQRSRTQTIETLANTDFQLPPALTDVAISAVDHNYRQLTADMTPPSAYEPGARTLSYSAGPHQLIEFQTIGYRRLVQRALAAPDLSSLSGWQNAWAPSSGAAVSWSVNVSGETSATGGSDNASISGTFK